MTATKVWIAVVAAVVILGAGVTLTVMHSGGSTASRTTATSIPAPTGDAAAGSETTAQPSSDIAQQLVGNLTSQLAQATNSGGQPRAITAEDAEALIRQQLQQLGITPPK